MDGSIIDIAGSNDQVYINRGRDDQIVLGMTFEIYGDAAQIRPNEDGQFPEGKGSLQVIKVAWNGGEISDLEGENERFVVQYFDPYTEAVQEKFIGLVAFDQGDAGSIPVADPGTYETLTVGEPITLNGVSSTPGPSGFDFGQKSHWWYLTGKPAGSQVYLNVEGTLTQSFTADVAGEYTLELQVKSDDSGAFLVSEPVSFTLYAQ